jgi:hypothetical protein
MEDFLKFPEVRDFLSDYPKGKWKLCIDSIFLYGLYTMKRDFPNGLSIPEMIRISGQEVSHIRSPLESPSSIRSSSRTRNEETQTLTKGFKDLMKTKEQEYRLKTSGSQTSLTKDKNLNRSRNQFKSDELEISAKVREPKIVSIENARMIMNTSSEIAFDKRRQKMGLDKEKWNGLDIKIDYMPKTISADLYKQEKFSIVSPKYRY